jgi:hypothetical protein
LGEFAYPGQEGNKSSPFNKSAKKSQEFLDVWLFFLPHELHGLQQCSVPSGNDHLTLFRRFLN